MPCLYGYNWYNGYDRLGHYNRSGRFCHCHAALRHPQVRGLCRRTCAKRRPCYAGSGEGRYVGQKRHLGHLRVNIEKISVPVGADLRVCLVLQRRLPYCQNPDLPDFSTLFLIILEILKS